MAIAVSAYSLIPLTGFSYAIANKLNLLCLSPAGLLATGTVTLAPAPDDGEVITITSTQTITALTINVGTAVHSIRAGITTIAANARWSAVYSSPIATWLPN